MVVTLGFGESEIIQIIGFLEIDVNPISTNTLSQALY